MIVSVTSYFCDNEAENLQNVDLHLPQILDFGMGYLKNHWHINVSGGLFFASFKLFHLNLTYFLT